MIKKALLSFLCAFFALTAYGAYDFQSGGLYYTITSSTNMTVKVSYNSRDGYTDAVYAIPNQVTYNGKTYYVTAIGSYAFSGCSALTTITFDEKTYVKTIEDHAFSGCNAMSRITIPANVTSIGNYAFSGCFTLKHVTIEDATTTLSLGCGSNNGYSYGLFADTDLRTFYWGRPLSYNTNYGRSPIANLPNLSKITIGSNVSTISPYMFFGNVAITSIELPATVTSLGNHAFHGFKGLTSFTIPKQITAIGDYAFADCTSLASLTIPEKVSKLGEGVFSGCTAFRSFVVPETVTSIGNYAFNGCTSMTGVVFEEGDETLSLGYNTYNGNGGKGMFFDCPLQSVFIGRNLSYNTSSSYGYSPFARIETLTKAHFGNPVKNIQAYMFVNCKSLKTFQYNKNCTPSSIGNYAFWGCSSLKEANIVYPQSVKTIGEGAFRDCTSLEGYTIPDHVTSVGNSAFMNCKMMKSVVVKPSVKSIGDYAFNGCIAMTGVIFEEGDETLSLGYNAYNGNGGKGMFFDCPLQSVFIGRNLSYSTSSSYGYSPFARIETLTKAHFGNPVKSIQGYLFVNCKSLTTFQYNKNCTPSSIGNYAFWGCTSLTETNIVYPQSVKTIGEGAFRDCTSLKGYTIPDHVTSVGNSAFMNCKMMKSVVVKPSVKSIGDYAFNGCIAMTGVIFEEGDETLSLGYNAYNGNGGKGMFFDCPLQSVFIGRNLSYSTSSSYGYSPFARIETLTKAHFGNPVKSIQGYLFVNCKSLTTFQYNKNCTPSSIGNYAFWGCSKLKEANIVYPKSVKTIGEGAFRDCTSLEGYTIPDHVTSVGNSAFMNCKMMKSVVVKPSVVSIGNFAFNGCIAMTGVVFEEGDETLSLGYNTYNYDGGKGLFYDCPLQSVFIGRNLSYSTNSSYGYSPFAKSETLTKAQFGKPVTYISTCLFFGVSQLRSVEFNDGCKLQSVNTDAFNGCTKLLTPTFPNTVTTFGQRAFRNCESFTEFDMPQSLATIGSNAFENCSKLREIVIPNKVSTIDKYVFSGCSALTNVIIPETITSLGEYAFHYCSSLTEFSCYSVKAPSVKTSTFTDTPIEKVTLYVPAVDAYQYAPWIDFKKIVKIGGPTVKLSKTKAVIEKGKTLTLKATVFPSDLSDDDVTWKSSNTEVATVTSTGKVKGVKTGTATITCTSKATGAKATCKVTVGSVKLNQTEIVVEKNKTKTLTATVNPSTLTDKTVTWTSSNTAIATVSSKGKVKGVKTGTATITCTSKATGLSATCEVTVGSVKLDQTEVAVNKGKTVTLTATVYPSTLTDKSVTWTSSNTAIATVSSKGKVKGVKTGTVTITYTSNATGLSATCEVTVGSVKLDQTEVTVKKGKTVTLKATVYPSTLVDKSVTWKSSNKSIATVTTGGKVKGVKAGTAKITCTSNATGLSTTCIVTVTGSASTRSLDGDDDELTGIDEIETSATVEPFDVYDLSGRKVRHQVTSLDGLPNGIYIVNGKKVLKKNNK